MSSKSFEAQLTLVCGLLESKGSRDKLYRLLGYTARFISALIAKNAGVNHPAVKRLDIVTKSISQFRVMLRLFDDIPMLAWLLQYGLGKEEKDPIIRSMSVVGNVLGQLYYPLEHLAHSADLGLTNFDSLKWWYRADWAWLWGIVCGFIANFRRLQLNHISQRRIAGKNDLDASERRLQRKKLIAERNAIFLNMLQDSADLGLAVHWLPAGYLWAEKLPNWATGLCGMTSSVVGLYKAINSASSAPSL
eukprot:Opistho-2@39238